MTAAKIAVVRWMNIDESIKLVYGDAAGLCAGPLGLLRRHSTNIQRRDVAGC
jgi:hypothetical protein